MPANVLSISDGHIYVEPIFPDAGVRLAFNARVSVAQEPTPPQG